MIQRTVDFFPYLWWSHDSHLDLRESDELSSSLGCRRSSLFRVNKQTLSQSAQVPTFDGDDSFDFSPRKFLFSSIASSSSRFDIVSDFSSTFLKSNFDFFYQIFFFRKSFESLDFFEIFENFTRKRIKYK